MTPPQNIEIEEAILGAMMVSERARGIGLRTITRDDFLRPSHRYIFDAIHALESRGSDIDELVVIKELASTKAPKSENADSLLEVVGGRIAILTISEKVPVVANAQSYADEVRRLSMLRAVGRAGDEMAAAAHEQSSPDEALNIGERGLLAVRERLTATGTGGVQSLDAALDEYCDAYAQGEDTDLVRFPLPSLNRINGGQRRGDVIFSSGWSGDGKTWFGLDCAEAAAQQGNPTLVVNIEVEKNQMLARQIAMGGHDFDQVMRFVAPQRDIAPRIAELRKLPIDIEDHGGPDMAYLRTLLMRARVAGRPYRYVYVDHFHIMRHMVAGMTDYRIAIGESARIAKQLAKEFACTLHFAAQLRRFNATGKAFPLPHMQDIREASQIENIADLALMVWRERNDDGVQQATGLVSVAKVRNGRPISPVPVTFHSQKYRFVETIAHRRAAA